MIDRDEVRRFAREFQLDPNVVEKDYALGWMLAGISNHEALTDAWVFKGGTCLKKCFFETYRFSEDLDFTLRDASHIDEEFLLDVFQEIADWIYESSGLELPADMRAFEVFTNPRGKECVQGKLGYRGPLGRIGTLPRIKLDLSADETLVLDPVRRSVHHPYSDRPENGIEVLSYSYEEVFAEKLRALTERLRPRDLYDVVHLHRRTDLAPDRSLVRSTLGSKCAFKEVAVPTFAALSLRPELVELQAEWENMLAHQLPALPPFEQFWGELPGVFVWLEEETPAAAAPTMAAIVVKPDTDLAWRPPAMAVAWNYAAPLEAIRFAAANRLCVDLGYDGRHRIIEPYSLRRSNDGNLLLYAVRHEDGSPRSYRVDRIESASVTSTPYIPRYEIELTASGPISAPSLAARASSPPISVRSPRATQPRRIFGGSPTYVYECPICRKRFRHKTRSPRLNPHKGKSGWNCSGRTGYLVDVKY